MNFQWPSLPEACYRQWHSSDLRERIALVSDSEQLDYAALAERTAAAAAALVTMGTARGDIVAIAMNRSIDAVIAILGALWAGACPCPLDSQLSAGQLRAMLSAVGAAWIVADDDHMDCARDLGYGASRLIAADFSTAAAYRDLDLGPDNRALLLFTSGSTGHPKGVMLSHRNLLSNADGVIRHTQLTDRDRLLHSMPLHHTNGLNNQIFAPLLAGATVVLGGRFKADTFPDLVDRHRPTIITGVPTMYARLLDQPFNREALQGLRMARCGSAPITEDLHRRVEAHMGCDLVVSYGLSEATCTSLMNPPGRRRIGTVGTVLHGQQVSLLKPGSSEPVADGEEGEIAISGPSLMTGYLGADPQADRAVVDGRLRTGDLGRFDADGYLTITGRLKEVIIRGGENLSPQAIEQALAADPGVRTCCVVGRAHHDLGQVPVAFVVLADGTPRDADRLCDLVASSLSRTHRPAEIIFLDALPETSVGKIDRKALATRVKQAADG
ncbi:class I adenylate-forming enzyme family protein [Fodinicurvata sp. EGI_FJ10296]|uniref:class I adenylate-forming enzyme family protein n=1 Tax=Fodinicurvata sp. EGI_FJ10296 TaxID=3231908 RepID=UPI003456F2B5